ncbi:hypothetical protein GCM10023313_07370 [Mucilaginibacter defluvii]|uniref:Phage abortive infection protein n=1 Tax=Mucilaginibacter defluvii TaxID=1196019 RepID=A0ABP9FST5_9SPHI
MAELKHSVEIAQNDISSNSSSVANVLASAGITLGIIALSLTGLGFWISNRATTVQNILTQVNEALSKTEKVKVDVQNLSNKMQDNLSQLFKDLQDEELKSILNLILKNPSHFNLYFPFINAKETAPKNQLQLFIDVLDSVDIGDKNIVYHLITKFYQPSIFLENENLLKVIMKTPDLIYTLSTSDEILDYTLDVLSIRYKERGLTQDEDRFVKHYFIPFARQNSFTVPNPFYIKIIEKFSIEYYLKHEKPNLTINDLNRLIVTFLSIEPLKYSNTQQYMAYNAFKQYLVENNYNFKINAYDDDPIAPEFFNYLTDRRFFKITEEI